MVAGWAVGDIWVELVDEPEELVDEPEVAIDVSLELALIPYKI